MSPGEPFEDFSRRLDETWLRERLRAAAPAAMGPAEEEALTRALVSADPLGARSLAAWRAPLRELLAVWPGRLAAAAAAGFLVLIGVAVGRITTGPRVQIAGPGVPPIAAYTPEREGAGRGLGATASIRPESRRHFEAAMALYGTPDFPARARPLLREAVTADPTNDRAQFWLGVVLLLEGKSAEAVAPLESAVRLAPGDTRAKQYLLWAYLQTGAVDKGTALQGELLK